MTKEATPRTEPWRITMSAVSPDPTNSPKQPQQQTSQAGTPGNISGSDPGRKPSSQPDVGKKAAKKASKKGTGDNDWNVFRTVVVLVGLVLAGFGAYYLILGTAGLPDTEGQPVNPTLENQFRFFSAMMVGVGAAFVTIAIKFEWANMLWLVCLMVFAGGIGRVLSWAFSGTPHYLMIILMVIELAFPAALLVWHKYIAKTTQMRKDYDARS
ncbi:hypothetical protein IWX75_001905 [Arthrobacter sp. CAN_A6]|uniref:DUF4345 domain-containing protein n=1 Tax=Arthrobacter sp. CAN_A6 TaxID=2787721 RepID=UPI0018CB843E